MWAQIAAGVGAIFNSWVDLKKAKIEGEAAYARAAMQGEQDWDVEALRQAQYSWKDEFITLIWYAPLIIYWVDPQEAKDWITFVGDMPTWYQFGMFGIMAASFGLRWIWKEKAFAVLRGGK